MPKRTDSTQASIFRAWRQVGATVQSLHTVGDGAPDALVGFRGMNYVAEIKTPRGRLTPAQVRWHRDWRGQVAIVETVDEALAVLGVIRAGV